MDKKVKWGVLGTASIARRATIPGIIEANNAQLVAIAGRNPEKVNDFLKGLNGVTGYTSYDELLDDERIEAVYIPLSNDLHKEWTIKALNKGKHVLCEKPLGISAAEVQVMIDAAKRNNRLLMEAYPYMCAPFLKRIKEIIGTGEIGDVIFIDSKFYTLRQPRTNIRMRRETFGGALYDMGCYNTTLALNIFGRLPEDVKAGGVMIPGNIDDSSTLIMDFGTDDHCRAVSSCGMVLGPGQIVMEFMVSGKKGIIKAGKGCFNGKGEVELEVLVGEKSHKEIINVPNNYMCEVECFSDSILNGTPLAVTNDFSLMSAKLLDRALLSMGY